MDANYSSVLSYVHTSLVGVPTAGCHSKKVYQIKKIY